MLQLEDLLRRAAGIGAGSVLLSVGHPPAARIGRQLQPPFDAALLTFQETEHIAESLLTDTERHQLLKEGSIEVPFEIAGISGTVIVFYGLGSHNMVFHLDLQSK